MDSRPNTALLVIDVQNDVVADAYQRNEVVANIQTVVDRARDANIPVIWVQHDDEGLHKGSDGWQIVPELSRQPVETIIEKQFRSSFEETALEQTLEDLNVGRLVVAGAQTDFCIRWTLHAANERGYATVLVADGHTTDAVSPKGMAQGAEIIAHTNSIWASQSHPRAAADVVATKDLHFA